MNMRLQALLVVALTAAVSVSANAAQFRFNDYSESPDIARLTVDGIAVTGGGDYGGGHISHFVSTVFAATGGGREPGERISFDYAPAILGAAENTYVKLMGAPDDFVNGQQWVSDEFLLYYVANGVYHVDFYSFDSPNGIMAIQHPGQVLPSPTVFNELPQWQLVGSIYPATGGSPTATFEVMSVPEPETYAMMLAGLGLLGAAARRRKQREAP